MEREDADGALDSWAQFCTLSNELLAGDGDLAVGPRLAPVVGDLCTRGLATLVRDYFLHSLEVHTVPSPPRPLLLSLARDRARTTADGLVFYSCIRVEIWAVDR
jgi:hypothetical protein